MMKRLLVVLALVTFPALAAAQPQECSECLLGLWDDVGLTNNYGTVTAMVQKDIYLGIKLGGGETGVTGIEFSVHGMRTDTDGILITNTEWTVSPAVTLGSINAPADSSQSTMGTGGMNVAWAMCQAPASGQSHIALARITILSFSPVPPNKTFVIKQKYPTSNVLYAFRPVFNRCDAPDFTAVVPQRGCYVANWDGTTDLPCDQKTAVRQTSWTGVKQLFE